MKRLYRKRNLVLVIILVVLFLFAHNAWAIENIGDLDRELSQQDQPTKSSDILLGFLKLILALGVIIAASWSIIRLFSHKVSARMQGNWLHVVDEVILGQNRGIVLCEIGSKLYALGVTDEQINLLFEVDNPDLLVQISQSDNSPPQKKPGSSLMDIVCGKGSRGFMGSNQALSRKDYHLLMQEQLQRIKKIPFPGNKERDHS